VTLWAGRVEVRLAPEVWAFLRAHDAELLPYDCAASRVHARRLHAAGVLSDDEFAEADELLASLDPPVIAYSDEDVHSAIERALGEVGGGGVHGEAHCGYGGTVIMRAAFPV